MPPAANELESEFHQAMLDIYRRAKEEAAYPANRFFHMVGQQGGVATAKYLVNSPTPSDGYTHLYMKGRLDLTVEALLLKPRWAPLFSNDELQAARERLGQYGFEPGA